MAGSVDAVFRRPKGTPDRRAAWEEEEESAEGWEYCVVDWKRSASQLSSWSGGKFCYPPLHELPDCTLTKYQLQGNLYAHLLRELMDLDVTEVYIVQFKPRGRKPNSIQVPHIDVAPLLEYFTAHRDAGRLYREWREEGEDPKGLFPE